MSQLFKSLKEVHDIKTDVLQRGKEMKEDTPVETQAQKGIPLVSAENPGEC